MRPALTLLKLESSPPVIAAALQCTACSQTATYRLSVRRLSERQALREWVLCEQHGIRFGNLMAALRADCEVTR